jgi:hypothetical protein
MTEIKPLARFRVIFGALVLFSIVRFWANGWIETLYIEPKFYFPYWGFEWVCPLSAVGTYSLFGLMFLAALGILTGFLYRISAIIFFLSFTYVELIDKTNYLNHYYFVSLVAFLLIFVPAHRAWSADVYLGWVKPVRLIPSIYSNIFKLQIFLVYFFAGTAKIQADWLLEAQPLRIWLASKVHFPFIGYFLTFPLTAYLFSWGGMLFDVLAGFALWHRTTRPTAYVFVVIFHLLTAILFPAIGMFPYMMILLTLIFFEKPHPTPPKGEGFHTSILGKIGWGFLIAYFALQVLIPLRFLGYPAGLFWHEQGYRFSWRVMLMEKTGLATFTIKDKLNNRFEEVDNQQYLTKQQEKMMSTQPDMMLQFAHFLVREYQKKGYSKPEVYVSSYVALNGRGSRIFIDPKVNLVEKKEGWKHKDWVLPFE